MPTDTDHLDTLDQHLSGANHVWLLGAGISKDAGIPLMGTLTEKVFSNLNSNQGQESARLLEKIREDLSDEANIEDVLSHLSDFAALAYRARSTKVTIGGDVWNYRDIVGAHDEVMKIIANIIRGGYFSEECYGTPQEPAVKVGPHVDFINALFYTAHSGYPNWRPPVSIFTTNYDTLIEDALALCRIPYWDGFTGGAVAFRDHSFGELPPKGYRAHLCKLHGSIDWHMGEAGNVWRVRANDNYPEVTGEDSEVLIYPRATKYVATQRDPFAAQFDLLRRTLSSSDETVFFICGYSFGDEHLNQEIEMALAREESATTLVAFIGADGNVPEPLASWRERSWGKKVIVVTSSAIYLGNDPPTELPNGYDDWWTFQGVTRLLRTGAGLGA